MKPYKGLGLRSAKQGFFSAYNAKSTSYNKLSPPALGGSALLAQPQRRAAAAAAAAQRRRGGAGRRVGPPHRPSYFLGFERWE